jgi:hypothetical protein
VERMTQAKQDVGKGRRCGVHLTRDQSREAILSARTSGTPSRSEVQHALDVACERDEVPQHPHESAILRKLCMLRLPSVKRAALLSEPGPPSSAIRRHTDVENVISTTEQHGSLAMRATFNLCR